MLPKFLSCLSATLIFLERNYTLQQRPNLYQYIEHCSVTWWLLFSSSKPAWNQKPFTLSALLLSTFFNHPFLSAMMLLPSLCSQLYCGQCLCELPMCVKGPLTKTSSTPLIARSHHLLVFV